MTEKKPSRASVAAKVALSINKQYGRKVIAPVDSVHNVYYLRRPSGIMQLDIDTGGGLPSATAHMISGPDGGGKCLGIGTPVLMYSGEVKPVEKVRKGELLMGPDSEPRKVLGTTRDRGQLFRIIPKKGDPWVCNDVHVLTLVCSSSGKVVDISLDEYLRKSAYFKREYLLFQPAGGVDFPGDEEQVQPIDPYFLGVWLGDGTKNLRSVGVSKPDAEIYQLCVDTANAWGLTVTTKVDEEGGCPTHSLVHKKGHANPLLDELRKLFKDGLCVPDAYLYATREVRCAVLAGLLDTDGHLANDRYYEIAQKSEGIAKGIMFLARSLGLRVTHRIKVVGGVNYHRINLIGDTSHLPMRIQRKVQPSRKNRRKGINTRNQLRVGFHVESIGEGEYAGFELDGDGRFLLGDFTVTHNTLLLYMYMAQQQRYYKNDCWLQLAAVEHPVDHFRLRGAGVQVAIPLERIEQEQATRKILKMPQLTKAEIAVLRTSVGTIELLHGNDMEDTLDSVLDTVTRCRKHGVYPNIIGIDSFTALTPRDIIEKDLDEAAKRAAHASCATKFFAKYFPLVTQLDDHPADVSLLLTQQVRANPEKATAVGPGAKYVSDWAIAGSWAAKHGKCFDILVSTGARERSDGKDGGGRQLLSKQMKWELLKAKAGSHEGIRGEVSIDFSESPPINGERSVMVAGIKYGILIENNGTITWKKPGEDTATLNRIPFEAFLKGLRDSDELDYSLRQAILNHQKISCRYY
jgi:hypothetical protein